MKIDLNSMNLLVHPKKKNRAESDNKITQNYRSDNSDSLEIWIYSEELEYILSLRLEIQNLHEFNSQQNLIIKSLNLENARLRHKLEENKKS
jgi:hypothetical protein